MLILQRKAGESLFIGEDIEISVVSVDSGGRVRLAIDAPRSLPILRSELRSAMTANQEAASEEATPLELLTYLESMVSHDD
jgi:carbon storage regulator